MFVSWTLFSQQTKNIKPIWEDDPVWQAYLFISTTNYRKLHPRKLALRHFAPEKWWDWNGRRPFPFEMVPFSWVFENEALGCFFREGWTFKISLGLMTFPSTICSYPMTYPWKMGKITYEWLLFMVNSHDKRIPETNESIRISGIVFDLLKPWLGFVSGDFFRIVLLYLDKSPSNHQLREDARNFFQASNKQNNFRIPHVI